MVELQDKTEESLWLTTYSQQVGKCPPPTGDADATAQMILCANYADDTIEKFRTRRGGNTLPIVNGTSDNDLYKRLANVD